MDELFTEIIDTYKKKDNVTYDLGLINGKTGVSLAYFIISKHVNDETLLDKSFDLLDAVTESISNVKESNFGDGLAGIGWTIEWLVQNNYFEADTDEILADVDDVIYKATLFAPDKNLSLFKGTLGKLFYFFYRFKSINPVKTHFKNIIHETCLIILTDELRDKLTGEKGLLKKDKESFNNEDLINLGHAIVFLSEFLNLKINEPTVESILYQSIKIVDELLKFNVTTSNQCEVKNLKHLTACYYEAGKSHSHNYWQKQAKEYLQGITNSEKRSGLNGNDYFLKYILPSAIDEHETAILIKNQLIANPMYYFNLINLINIVVLDEKNATKGIGLLQLLLFDIEL